MGSIFKSKAPTPPPPPPAPIIRDEIGGVEQVPIKNADGTTTYVTRRIALSPAKQAEMNEFNRIMKSSLKEITRISSTGFEHDDATKNILSQWEEQNKEILSEVFTDRREEEEKILARRGLRNSSAGNDVRRQRNLDKQGAFTQLQRERAGLSSDIRANKLAQQQNLFNLSSSKLDLDGVRAQQATVTGQRAFSSVNSLNKSSIANYYRSSEKKGSGLQDISSLFSNVNIGGVGGGGKSGGGSGGGDSSTGEKVGGAVGGAVGTSVGGPIGGVVGSMIGSAIGGMF